MERHLVIGAIFIGLGYEQPHMSEKTMQTDNSDVAALFIAWQMTEYLMQGKMFKDGADREKKAQSLFAEHYKLIRTSMLEAASIPEG
jgi:hypothetical protein